MGLTKRRSVRLFAGLALIALVALALSACTAQGRGIARSDHGPLIWEVNLSGGPTFTGSIRFFGPKVVFVSTGDVFYDFNSSNNTTDVLSGTGRLNDRPVNYTLSYNENTGYTTFDATGANPNSHYHITINGNVIPKVQIKN